jgi:putative iron-dependent peroxidase
MDGTENPAELALRLETAVIKDGKNAGGAFAIHQTWIHDVKSFEALPEHEQVF